MEMEKTYASKGVANTALGTGIAGLSLGLLNGMGGLFGNGFNNGCGYNGYGYNNAFGCCSDDRLVNRYEAKQSQEIAEKDSKIALLEANTFTDKKIADVFERVSTRIRALENSVNENTCNQAVTNQQIVDNIKFVDSKFDGVYKDIKAGDAAVKCYVDCHFVPGKLIMPLDSICPAAEPAVPVKK